MFQSEAYDLCFQCLKSSSVCSKYSSTVHTNSSLHLLWVWITFNVHLGTQCANQLVMRIAYKITLVNKREAFGAPCDFLPKLKLYGLMCKKWWKLDSHEYYITFFFFFFIQRHLQMRFNNLKEAITQEVLPIQSLRHEKKWKHRINTFFLFLIILVLFFYSCTVE